MTDFEPLILDLLSRNRVKVPPSPGVAMRLQQLVASGTHDVASLTQVVATDQALTAAVLRFANAAAVRGVDRITSLGPAVARIGAEELVRIALVASVGQSAARPGVLGELRQLAWRRGLTAALAARLLAHGRRANPEEVFVCGLLHDFGWLVGLSCLEELLGQRACERARSTEEWMAVIDPFHIQLGLLVAEQWKLSPLLWTVISEHHEAHSAPVHREVVELVAAADKVVVLLEAEESPSPEAIGRLGVVEHPAGVLALAQALPQIPPLVTRLLEALPSAPAPGGSSLVSGGPRGRTN